jgi:heterodisulfide reductase subunit A-like polyferredoxin
VELDENNFVKTHPNRPLDTSVPGIFACGCAQGPIDIPESVAQASSAAARAAEIVMTGGRAFAI